jgi:hypothetical protein
MQVLTSIFAANLTGCNKREYYRPWRMVKAMQYADFTDIPEWEF